MKTTSNTIIDHRRESAPINAELLSRLETIVAKHWGFSTLRPLQATAMSSIMEKRDSLVVLPTGGGKSLCYQAPALALDQVTVVISPLISLMKDQVDSLSANGIQAALINSSQTAEERAASFGLVRSGKAKLLFVSPERATMEDFLLFLEDTGVDAFIVDEAHCISHWGHDFRPEYRKLIQLKQIFPGASIHAFTATATEQVRKDIANQLGLINPELIIGGFDRPNLTYRVVTRHNALSQVLETLERHKKEAGIIYCISRKQVDQMCSQLLEHGIKARAYHAGMSIQERNSTHDAFAKEECDVVVATIAFGMGIDRSDVRFVIHTGLPKSLEHYQQETGRAGRDGLEAECLLLFSHTDIALWRSIIDKSAAGMEDAGDSIFIDISLKHLEHIITYACAVTCRHANLMSYFGQEYTTSNHSGDKGCNACDICLGELQMLEDPDTVAKKILSCVARMKESFGISHVVSVLRGENNQAVKSRNHESLSTYGLLKGTRNTTIKDWIYQLVNQGKLVLAPVALAGGRRVMVLKLNFDSWEVMRGKQSVKLTHIVNAPKQSQAEKENWEGVHRELFESLRDLRRELARENGCAPYIIAHDSTLRDLARTRPRSAGELLAVPGFGKTKIQRFGNRILECIEEFAG